MASGVNLERKSGVGVPKRFVVVLNLILAIPATSLVPNCNDLAVPLDSSPTWRGGGGGGGEGVKGMLHGQQPVPHITLPRLTSILSPTPTSKPGEDTPASPSVQIQHGEQQIPVISHRSIGVEQGARGCSRRWERSSDFTGQLSPASSWAAPSQEGVVPPRSAILIGCMGIRDHPKSRLEPWHQATTNVIIKKTSLKLGCSNVRTMITGLSASLQDIKDSRKTAVINDELKRLNVDIAALQETRHADPGALKEKDYILFWRGKRSNEPREHRV